MMPLTDINTLSDREVLLIAVTEIKHLTEKQEEFNQKLTEQDKKINLLMESRNKIFGSVLALGVVTTLVNVGLLIANLVSSGS